MTLLYGALVGMVLTIEAVAAFEFVTGAIGPKAHQQDYCNVDRARMEIEMRAQMDPETYRRVYLGTRVLEVEEGGCTWTRFMRLHDLLNNEKTSRERALVRIAIAKQFLECHSVVTDLPEDDGVTPSEKEALSLLSKRITQDKYDDLKLMAMNALAYLKEDRNLTFEHVKETKDKRREFHDIFRREMDFCFQVDKKLNRYYWFVDELTGPTQIWTWEKTYAKTMPALMSRIKLGLICRAFLDQHVAIEEIAFKKTMGKWYNFKKTIKEITSDDD